MAEKKSGIYHGFTRKDIAKMKDLWRNNSYLTNAEIRKKWDKIIGNEEPSKFINRLKQLTQKSKEKLKAIYEIDESDSAAFETLIKDTLTSLTRSYLSN